MIYISQGRCKGASDFIFIDLDLADFKSKRVLDLALNKTLKNIRERLEGHPTVLWILSLEIR